MTKTQVKDAEVHEEWSRLHNELGAVIREEFPRGTKVKYRFGQGWIYGTVEEHPTWTGGDELKIKNTKTGTTRNVKAKELEFDTDNTVPKKAA